MRRLSRYIPAMLLLTSGFLATAGSALAQQGGFPPGVPGTTWTLLVLGVAW